MKTVKTPFFALMVVAGSLALIAFGLTIATSATNGFGAGVGIILMMLGFMIVFLGVAFFFFARFYSQAKMNKSLEFENLYSLGESMPLFNLYAFQQAGYDAVIFDLEGDVALSDDDINRLLVVRAQLQYLACCLFHVSEVEPAGRFVEYDYRLA